MKRLYDVIVVGGGHAGCEAAAAAARQGAHTALVTHRLDTVGAMSCNPAFGGLGKGHLVREIDALDGLMGVAADAAALQFRLLNRRKGPAVQGPRVQADRAAYKTAMRDLLAGYDSLELVAAPVADLLTEDGRCVGVATEAGEALRAGAVVLTTGTFLRGMIHRGAERIPAGRVGEDPSTGLAATLERYGFPLGRLKTGTPPRLDARTVATDRLAAQPGDDRPVPMSFMTGSIARAQHGCWISRTTPATHAVIRENLASSALYGGYMASQGPRYCPSIEDKVVRFADKQSHQVFLEPEGAGAPTIYPNGISTSLPPAGQEAFVRTMPGLEAAEITQPGYAIEYDHVDPRALDADLQTRALPGLFLAGQINGTTGYEEAGAQGLIAGANAARRVGGRAAFTLDRADGYIGVLIDDLIHAGAEEPYRMFTSRAEYRLLLRADNADQRLTEKGRNAGLVGDRRWQAFSAKAGALAEGRAALQAAGGSPRDLRRLGLAVKEDGVWRSAFALLGHPQIGRAGLESAFSEVVSTPDWIIDQLAIEAQYAGYLERQEADIRALRQDEALEIPRGLDFGRIPGLSNEAVEKLSAARPATLGAAARIPGVTPAAVVALLHHVKAAA